MQKVLTLNDLDVKGKKVLLRCSFDVPIDSSKGLLDPKRVRDDSRIKDAIPTLAYLIKNNAKIILSAGWLGRPDGEDAELSMAPVALRLQEILKEKGILKHEVLMTPNCLDGSKPRSVYKNKEEVAMDVSDSKEGQVIVLENVRYDPESNSNDHDFARFIASLAGKNAAYVNEAEAQNHRPEATIVSVPRYIAENGGNVVFGFKMADVIKYIGSISKLLGAKGRGSFIFFLSGKKIETQVGITSKISVTHSLLDKMRHGDILAVQGAVTYTFLLAKEYFGIIEKKIEKLESIIVKFNKKQKEETERIKKENKGRYSQIVLDIEFQIQREKSEELKEAIGISDMQIKSIIGNSFVEWKEIGEQIIFAARVLLKSRLKGVEVLLSVDHTITNSYPDKYGNLPADSEIKIYNEATGIPEGWVGVAPGPKTLDIICRNVKKSYFLILAGPVSIEDSRVEEISHANKKLIGAIKEAKDRGSVTICAGGDTAAVINKNNGNGAFTVISNAGGATLELIEKDGKLPGITAVEECNKG